MDFEKILKILTEEFERNKIRYALIGGFSLGVWGVSRTTIDLDFLIHKDDMPIVDKILKNLGYECKFKSKNVSQYVSPLKIFGEIDVLYAFRDISVKMLQRSEEKEVFNGKLKIRVLKPEDIIGLKLQALVNDEERTEKELVDIEELIKTHKDTLNWRMLEEYFELFEKKELFKKIKQKYGVSN